MKTELTESGRGLIVASSRLIRKGVARPRDSRVRIAISAHRRLAPRLASRTCAQGSSLRVLRRAARRASSDARQHAAKVGTTTTDGSAPHCHRSRVSRGAPRARKARGRYNRAVAQRLQCASCQCPSLSARVRGECSRRRCCVVLTGVAEGHRKVRVAHEARRQHHACSRGACCQFRSRRTSPPRPQHPPKWGCFPRT